MSSPQDIGTVAPRMPSRPSRALPAGACDTHAHVFGPYDRFPFAGASNYPPPLAPLETYLDMLDRIGADRGVLIQPAPYETDTRALTDVGHLIDIFSAWVDDAAVRRSILVENPAVLYGF